MASPPESDTAPDAGLPGQASSPHEPSSASQDAAPILDPTRLAEAKQYNWRQFQCDMADRAIDVIYLSGFAFLAAIPVDRWLMDQGLTSASLRLVAMYIILTGGHLLVSFPLSFYSGHVLEHRYQLSRLTIGGWLRRYALRHLLTFAFGVPTSLGLYWIIWTVGGWWWLVAAGVFFLLSIVLGQLAPVLIMPLFYKIERLQDEDMHARFRKISEGTGLTVEGVYRMQLSDETVKGNAMLAGVGRTRRVILGDTLIDGFSPQELDVVFAHEVGHHVHRHVPKMIATGLIYSVAGFAICDVVLKRWVLFQSETFQYGELPIYALPLLTLVTSVFLQAVEPVQNGLSRHFEREADTYALRRTGSFDAFRSAFIRLASQNKADPDPHPLEVFLFHSHPPIAARLQLAENLARPQG